MDNIYCRLLEFGSLEQNLSIELRRKVLREPLGLDFKPIDLAAESDQFHFAVFCNDALVGILLLKAMKDIGDNILKMRQVAVDPYFKSKGYGSILVKFSEAWALENAYKIIELNARNTARNFYKNLGYEEIGEEFLEVNIPHIKMLKNLM